MARVTALMDNGEASWLPYKGPSTTVEGKWCKLNQQAPKEFEEKCSYRVELTRHRCKDMVVVMIAEIKSDRKESILPRSNCRKSWSRQ